MSKFSYSDFEVSGSLAMENINKLVALLLSGDIQRVQTGDALEGEADTHNDFLIGSGGHEGFAIKKPLGALWGAPGARASRIVNVTSHSFITGIFFKQEDDPSNINHLVKVSNDARVVFSNCIFQRKYNAPVSAPAPGITNCFVLVEAGSSASFEGCVFRSNHATGVMNGAGTAVQNENPVIAPALGPLPGVYISGGSNLTSHAHGLTVTRLGGEV